MATIPPESLPQMASKGRRQRALSQEELAHTLGVSFATVNRWENGKTAPMRGWTVIQSIISTEHSLMSPSSDTTRNVARTV